jgi:hypothetical protein
LSCTPYERFFGVKPSAMHMSVFGCVVHVHVPAEKRKKLDTRSRLGTFVGYEGSHYLVLMEDTRRVEPVRNVVFDESVLGHSVCADAQQTCALVPSFAPAGGLVPVDGDVVAVEEPVASEDSYGSADEVPIPPMPVQEPVGAEAVGAAEDFSAEDSVGATEAVVAPVADLPRRSERNANRPAVRYSPRSGLAQVPAAPADYQDAMSRHDALEWQQAMNEEVASLAANHTWSIVPLPRYAKPIPCRWVFA